MRSFGRHGVLALAALLHAGCITVATAQKAMGQRAAFEFWTSGPDLPEIQLFWRETPSLAESMLAVRDLPVRCERPHFYVNPHARNVHLIGRDSVSVRPLSLKRSQDLESLWDHLKDTPCALLVFAGRIRHESFSGVILRTRTHEIARMSHALSDDRSSAPLWWLAVPMALGVYEAPTLLLGGPFWLASTIREGRAFSDSVVVSFEMPDGAVHATTIDAAEARRLLEATRYRPRKPWVFASWELIQFWSRAALVKLALPFREKSDYDPEALGGTDVAYPELTHVAGFEGSWAYSTGDSSPIRHKLSDELAGARSLRFFLRAEPAAASPR